MGYRAHWDNQNILYYQGHDSIECKYIYVRDTMDYKPEVPGPTPDNYVFLLCLSTTYKYIIIYDQSKYK